MSEFSEFVGKNKVILVVFLSFLLGSGSLAYYFAIPGLAESEYRKYLEADQATDRLEAETSLLRSELQERREDLQEAREKRDRLYSEMEQRKAEYESISQRLDQKKAEYNELKKEYNEQKEIYDGYIAEKRQLESKFGGTILNLFAAGLLSLIVSWLTGGTMTAYLSFMLSLFGISEQTLLSLKDDILRYYELVTNLIPNLENWLNNRASKLNRLASEINDLERQKQNAYNAYVKAQEDYNTQVEVVSNLEEEVSNLESRITSNEREIANLTKRARDALNMRDFHLNARTPALGIGSILILAGIGSALYINRAKLPIPKKLPEIKFKMPKLKKEEAPPKPKKKTRKRTRRKKKKS